MGKSVMLGVHCRPSGPDISPISVTPPDNLVARYQGPISARFSFLGAPRYRASAAARFSPDFQTSPDFRPISYSILTRFSLDFQTSIFKYRASAAARFSPDFQTSPDFQARFLTRFSLDFQTSPDSHSIFKHHPILTRFSSPISHSILTRF
jgi:hypothetical protein